MRAPCDKGPDLHEKKSANDPILPIPNQKWQTIKIHVTLINATRDIFEQTSYLIVNQ
jgi:hypothetical protein